MLNGGDDNNGHNLKACVRPSRMSAGGKLLVAPPAFALRTKVNPWGFVCAPLCSFLWLHLALSKLPP